MAGLALAALGLFGTMLAAWDAVAQSTPKVARIGTISGGTLASRVHTWNAFRQSLRELGYIEGRNYILEERSLERETDLLDDQAAHLVHWKPDVIVALGSDPTLAAKRATSTVPIVMTAVADPEVSGIVTSLSRPGGNVTGLSLRSTEISAKRIELLKELAPRISKVAIVGAVGNPAVDAMLRQAEAGARSLGIEPMALRIRKGADIAPALGDARAAGIQGFIVLESPLLVTHREEIVRLIRDARLPAIYGLPQFVDSGGLVAYGPNIGEMMRRTAVYVDRILRGAKPAELPVERPQKLELVINLRTAKEIGLAVPKAVLFRADRVIE